MKPRSIFVLASGVLALGLFALQSMPIGASASPEVVRGVPTDPWSTTPPSHRALHDDAVPQEVRDSLATKRVHFDESVAAFDRDSLLCFQTSAGSAGCTDIIDETPSLLLSFVPGEKVELQRADYSASFDSREPIGEIEASLLTSDSTLTLFWNTRTHRLFVMSNEH